MAEEGVGLKERVSVKGTKEAVKEACLVVVARAPVVVGATAAARAIAAATREAERAVAVPRVAEVAVMTGAEALAVSEAEMAVA